MNAMEKMLRSMFSAMDLDVEAIKEDVLGRVAAFENNVALLNATLTAHHRMLARIETKLDLVAAAHNIDLSTANETENTNGSGTQHDTPTLITSGRSN